MSASRYASAVMRPTSVPWRAPDPGRLLQGDGKYMRHVKLRPDVAVDAASLAALIVAAYQGIKARMDVD